MDKGKLNIWADFRSQPCRAVHAFCLVANVPHTYVFTDMSKGEHLQELFLSVNPNNVFKALEIATVLPVER